MAVEERRSCGYRKVNGLYLVGEGLGVSCDILPKNVEVCPVCGEGIRQSLNIRWIDGEKFFIPKCDLKKHSSCHELGICVLCMRPEELKRCGLMFVGNKFYTPSSFIKEAEKMGVSKRIAHIPKGLELGKTWILLAHPKAGIKEVPTESKNLQGNIGTELLKVPAIFYAFRPTRVEKIITETKSKDGAYMEKLKEQGITPVIVPDNDEDHQGSVYKKGKKREDDLDED